MAGVPPCDGPLIPRVHSGLESCPGCGTRFAPHAGPTHPYIGAHPGCWALYTALVSNQAPDPAIIGASVIPEGTPAVPAPELPGAGALLVDAYAVQHHGDPTPQAIQSVAVHLLTLHGVFETGVAVRNALWVRRRALRERGVFRWLTPPRGGAALTIRHLFAGGRVIEPAPVAAYVRSVFDAWTKVHGVTIQTWYAEHVLDD